MILTKLLINFLTILSQIGVIISALWLIRQCCYTAFAKKKLTSEYFKFAVSKKFSIKKPLIFLLIFVAFLIAKAIV
ncbi:hypothetical protein ACFL23_01240 [Patescibacteria group bacterium]